MLIMLRSKLREFFKSVTFQKIIVPIIMVNSLLIGVETSDTIMNSIGHLIGEFDTFIVIVFSIEIILKLFAFGFSFFRSPWNVFDLIIVCVSVMPSGGIFSIFRALRIIRTLRLLRNVPQLKLIIESLIKSIPSIGWIGILLMLTFYIYAVLGVNLFAHKYPEYYGDLGAALFTLFQIMTLESWASAVARPIMDGVPFSSIYFVSFILIATYTTLNVFIAVVVNTMNDLSLQDLHEEEENIKHFVHEENEKLHKRLDELTKLLKEKDKSKTKKGK